MRPLVAHILALRHLPASLLRYLLPRQTIRPVYIHVLTETLRINHGPRITMTNAVTVRVVIGRTRMTQLQSLRYLLPRQLVHRTKPITPALYTVQMRTGWPVRIMLLQHEMLPIVPANSTPCDEHTCRPTSCNSLCYRHTSSISLPNSSHDGHCISHPPSLPSPLAKACHYPMHTCMPSSVHPDRSDQTPCLCATTINATSHGTRISPCLPIRPRPIPPRTIIV